MKQHYLFLALAWLAFCTSIHAQITVTNSVFPIVGDTLDYIIGNQPGAINQIFTPPGGGQVWNLSTLQPAQVWNQIMKTPQTGAASASFPTASVLFNPLNSSDQVYWQVTGNQVNNLGYFGQDPLGLGMNLLFINQPSLEESWAPINFFDIRQSTSNVLTAFDASSAPAVLLNLVPTADSFRIRVTYQRLGVIDAWGTLAIPGGNFDVLRKKQTEYKSTAVDVKVAPLGWIDISTIGGQQILPLGTDTTSTFHFLNDASKEAIAICTLNNAQDQVISVQYKQTVSVPNPMISSIEDGDANDMVSVGTLLTYTITFNEDIDATTVTAADFNNAGTATISIGTIIETSPGVFTVQVTPTTAGTLILRIPNGAVIADLDGNNLVVPVLDETTICIPPSITNLPQSASVFVNATASFFVVATGGGTLSYNWEVLPASDSVWMDIAPALDGNDTLMVDSISIADNGNQYRVVITDSASPSCPPVISNPATLTVLLFSPIVGDADSSNQAIGAVIDQFLMQTQNPPEIFDPCTCRNNTGVIPNGTSTDDGLFDDEIIVISPTAGDTWEIADEMGSVFPFATNANPSAQPGDLTRVAPGAPLSYIGSVNTMNGIRYIYRLQIIHKDNEGYNVSVRETSKAFYSDITLPISNRCYYPTPAINGLDAAYCVDEPAVTLMGTVNRGDGQTATTPESALFSINNNPVVQFNPQTLGAGAFTVVYTVDAAEEGATIPGCVQAVSQQVQVNSVVAINPLLSRTTCSTKKIALADLFKGVVYDGNPADLRYTWTIKENGDFNGILEGLQATDPNIGTYTPGKDAVSRGFVTLVLTVDNPNDACASTSAEVRIPIAKIDCGDFPWNGN